MLDGRNSVAHRSENGKRVPVRKAYRSKDGRPWQPQSCRVRRVFRGWSYIWDERGPGVDLLEPPLDSYWDVREIEHLAEGSAIVYVFSAAAVWETYLAFHL